MKLHEEIKKGARHCISDYSSYHCGECPYRPEGGMCKSVLHTDLLSLIQQLESTVSQVSKALCGKENVSWVEVLDAVDQLKSRLAQVKRERDAAVHDIGKLVKRLGYGPCRFCRKAYETNDECCSTCVWQWRGVCPENTKEDK